MIGYLEEAAAAQPAVPPQAEAAQEAPPRPKPRRNAGTRGDAQPRRRRDGRAGGRLRRQRNRPSAGTRRTAAASAEPPSRGEEPTAAPAASDRRRPRPRQEETLPMSPIRRRIAERLVQAQQNAALVTTFNEIDMSAVDRAAREVPRRISRGVRRQAGVHVVLREGGDRGAEARAGAERRDPRLRRRVSPLLRHRHRHRRRQGPGRARAAQRRADEFRRDRAGDRRFRRSGPGKQAQAGRAGRAGRSRSPTAGVYGSLLSTPIINPPQSGILGMHAIQDRPVARERPGRRSAP